jgi:hypothetical protein
MEEIGAYRHLGKSHARRTDPSYIRCDHFLGFWGHLAAKANQNAQHTSA